MYSKQGDKTKAMPIIRWDPFGLGEDAERFLEGFPHWPSLLPTAALPAIDLYEKKDKLIAEVALPGIDPDKIEVSVEKDVLTIKGEMERKKEIEEKDYYRKEIRRGSIYRTLHLPVRVEGEKAEAAFENGVLRVEIPKAPKVKEAKGIKVKVIKKGEKG